MGLSRRKARIDSLREALALRQQPNGCWSWTVLGTAVNLLALHLFSEDINDPVVRRGLGYLDHQQRRLPNGNLYHAWTGSVVWDTALAAEILLLADVFTAEEARRIGRALVSHQTVNGLTAFDTGVSHGDNDSTAVVLSYLGKTYSLHGGLDHAWLIHAIEKCVEGLAKSQLSDGGWGFAPSHPVISFGAMRPHELNAVLNDASSPDLTARVVLGLMAARQSGCLDMAILDRLDNAIVRAVQYFEASQHKDGYWWSRWSGKPVVATSLVLLAARSTEVAPKSSWIVRARSWLANRGGEHTPVEMAWKMAGLAASSPEIRIDSDALISEVATELLEGQEQKTWKSQPAYPFGYRVDLYAAPLFDHITICFAMILADRAFLKGCGEARSEVLWGRRRSKVKTVRSHNSAELAKLHQELVNVARKLAGNSDAIGQRIVAHYSVYRDSGRNFTFPLLALHGAGWAHGYFRCLNFLLPWYATFRFPISWRKRAQFKETMIRAMAGFKAANQRVLVDTYANYHFTKRFGRVSGAATILPQPLLSILNQVHEATANGEPLTNNCKSLIYSESFEWEQSNSVWPMVERTIRDINDPIVRAFAFRPIVRFAFFPQWKVLFFSDFTKTRERIDEGWKAYHIAECVGWATTENAIRKYTILPLDLLEYYRQLLKRIATVENLTLRETGRQVWQCECPEV